MSPLLRPVEVVRLLLEAHAAGDARRMAALLDPDVEATSVGGRGVHRGVEDVLAVFAPAGAGRRTELAADRIVAVGEEVSVVGRVRVRDRGTLSDSPAAWRFSVHEGRVRRIVALEVATTRREQLA